MITASIVTYHNNDTDLKKVISSFLNTTLNIKLYISDNSSNDNIKKLCSDSRIEYIYNNSNLGFGKAHNIAIKKAEVEGSKYHIILNPDIYFDPNVVSILRKYMEKNTNVGLVMPKINYPDGSTQYLCKLLPTPFNLIARRFLPSWNWVKKLDEKYEMRETKYETIVDVPYLSGCFMFIRTNVLKKIGYFDENIFMYLEDTDLTRRIHEKYRTVMNPEVSIYHKWEKGSYKSFKLMKYNVQAAIYYFNKYGWFFDKERNKINKETILKYKRGRI